MSAKKLHINIAFCILIHFVLILAALTPVSANETYWEKFSSNGSLTLWVNSKTGLPKILDQRTGAKWVSLPESLEKQNDLWKTIYSSAFIIRFLSKETNANTVVTAYTGASDCHKTIEPIPNGARCKFTFNSQVQLSFVVEYTLHDDLRMRINIPYKSIEDPKQSLLDIRILPYFGHLTPGSNGYVVLPDGIGGIINASRIKSLRYIPSRVYGERFFWTVERNRYDRYGPQERYLNFYDYASPNFLYLNMPIFGIVQKKAGMLAVISGGEYQAQIGPEVTPDDLLLSVSPQLIFREITYDMYTRAQSSPVFAVKDRTVDYYFLPEKDATYAGIARKYREILFSSSGKKQRLKPENRYRLRLFFGVQTVYKDVRELLTLTTFKEAEEILMDLHQKGVRDLDVIVVGWSNRGYLGGNPRHFPPDRRFGGTSGLKRLIATGKKLGYSIGIQFDNSYTYKRNRGYSRQETVKDIQNISIDIGFGQKEYLLCPEIAWERFKEHDLKRLQQLGVNGLILIDGIKQGMWACYDDKHQCGPPEMAQIFQKSAETIHKDNPVGMVGGMIHLAPSVAAIMDLSPTASYICDQAIPLTPIVLHGKVGYSFEPINQRRQQKREFLKMVEFGGIPNAFLTANSLEKMKDAQHNLLFSGKYEDWRSATHSEYQIYSDQLKSLQTMTIHDHYQLDRGVFMTVYEDGVSTIVNYSKHTYDFLGIKIKADDFAIINRNHNNK